MVGICAAFAGLIGIQIYWIATSVRLEHEKLAHSANEALAEAVDKLERHETLSKLKTHREAKYLFVQDNNSDTAPNFPPDDSLIQYRFTKSVERNGDTIEIDVVERTDDHTVERKVTQSISRAGALREWEATAQLSQHDTAMVQKLQPGTDPLAPAVERLRKRFDTKKTYLGDIVKSLMEVNLNQPITERVDSSVFDSLLRGSFQTHGISVPFVTGIFSAAGRMESGAEAHKAALQHSAIRVKLFPNDVIQTPYYAHLVLPTMESYLFKSVWVLLLISGVLISGLMAAFYYTLRTVVRQKKNSEIKNDFINNMTHELKTPISTIALACEALADPELGSVESIKKRYVGIINTENKRLGVLVEEVLQSAALDKGDFKLDMKELDLNTLLREAADKFEMQVKEREGACELNLSPIPLMIMADGNHLINVIYNLLDNALKYSREKPEIRVESQIENGRALFTVNDNGIGISRDNLKHVFERLYRVPTGNLHNVKGFGLGLSYVKIIAERHGGTVWADSTLGKGSSFTVSIPLHEQHGNI